MTRKDKSSRKENVGFQKKASKKQIMKLRIFFLTKATTKKEGESQQLKEKNE